MSTSVNSDTGEAQATKNIFMTFGISHMMVFSQYYIILIFFCCLGVSISDTCQADISI